MPFVITAVLGLTACGPSDNSAKFEMSPDDQDRITQGEQAVLEKNPQLNTEYKSLEERTRTAPQQPIEDSRRYREHEFEEFEQNILRPEVEKNSPALVAIYAQRDLVISNNRSNGLTKFTLEHKFALAPWTATIYLLTLLTFVYAIVLLFRTPTLGSANLLLALTLLPSTLVGFAIIHELINWFYSSLSGIYDFPMTKGELLHSLQTLICRTYEFAVPSLLIYLVLLIRIARHSSSKKN